MCRNNKFWAAAQTVCFGAFSVTVGTNSSNFSSQTHIAFEDAPMFRVCVFQQQTPATLEKSLVDAMLFFKHHVGRNVSITPTCFHSALNSCENKRCCELQWKAWQTCSRYTNVYCKAGADCFKQERLKVQPSAERVYWKLW